MASLATIEGYFAAAWFGWAQADPPAWLVPPLIVGSVLGIGLAVAAVIGTIRARGEHTPLRDPGVRRHSTSTSRDDADQACLICLARN